MWPQSFGRLLFRHGLKETLFVLPIRICAAGMDAAKLICGSCKEGSENVEKRLYSPKPHYYFKV